MNNINCTLWRTPNGNIYLRRQLSFPKRELWWLWKFITHISVTENIVDWCPQLLPTWSASKLRPFFCNTVSANDWTPRVPTEVLMQLFRVPCGIPLMDHFSSRTPHWSRQHFLRSTIWSETLPHHSLFPPLLPLHVVWRLLYLFLLSPL